MHPEIEKLIRLAIADGDVSEKERSVIMRKAEELGEDIDEVELILNGELALKNQLQKTEHQSSPPIQSNKEGNLKKCPSCGAPVPSFSLFCAECGHEFRNTEATVSVNEFFKQVKSAKTEDRAMIISNYPIPNNKEDLIEFITLAIGHSTELSTEEKLTYRNWTGSYKPELHCRDSEIKAWQSKAEAGLMKARLLFSDEPQIIQHINNFDKKFDINKNSTKRANQRKLIIGILFVIAFWIFVYLITKNKF
jgi:hypothetical protein